MLLVYEQMAGNGKKVVRSSGSGREAQTMSQSSWDWVRSFWTVAECLVLLVYISVLMALVEDET